MVIFEPVQPPHRARFEDFLQEARFTEGMRQRKTLRNDSLRVRFLDLRAKYPSKITPFGSKDSGVDLLTRAAQVDLESDQALIDLVLWGGILWPQDIERLKSGEGQELARTLGEVRDSAAVCYLLLSDIADGAIRTDVVAWINEHAVERSEYLASRSLLPELEAGPFELETIPLEALHLSSFVREGGIKHAFAEEMRGLLRRLVAFIRDAPAPLADLSGVFASRCEECLSPFTISKAGHRFCSPRCAARHGQRRRRKERHSV